MSLNPTATDAKLQFPSLLTGYLFNFQAAIISSILGMQVMEEPMLLKNRLLTEDINGMNLYCNIAAEGRDLVRVVR